MMCRGRNEDWFIGCVASSERFLSALLREQTDAFEVVVVVSLAPSMFNADFVDLGLFCRQFNVQIHCEDRANRAASLEFFKACEPDVIFCMGWSYLIEKELLSLPRYGLIGFHPAQLPQNRARFTKKFCKSQSPRSCRRRLI